MTPRGGAVAESRAREPLEALGSRIVAGMAPQPAAILTREGRAITDGFVEFAGSAADWTAVVRALDRPGAFASMYFSDGLREVLLSLADGRLAAARIVSTTFLTSGERVCRLSGCEPLPHAA